LTIEETLAQGLNQESAIAFIGRKVRVLSAE
jgi:hypothetical protein